MSDSEIVDQQDSNKEITQSDSDIEIIEAKTAVILLHSSQFITKNEYIQWRLTSLFQPLALDEKTENIKVLYLSHQRKHNWLSEYKNDDSNSILLSTPATPLSPTLKRSTLPRTKYVLTPRTNVITVMPECRLVFIVDLSSSLATVGNTKSQILLFEVFRTLRNALEGLVHPFCLQTSPTERIMLRPTLKITVLADCSQFASNVNVIPMLEDHPTMRVFLQNVLLNLHTIDIVIADLYDSFRVFQKDTTTHRKQMKQKRASLGYNLDVGEGAIPTYDRTLFDPTTTTHTTEETTGVWGMGKTGANLSRMLHAGAFATGLFDPAHGRAQLILITDGALKAQIQDNALWRQFAEQDLACHVIQIGFPHSFIPGRNFGFLPDVEILKFLAQATGGTFLYSNECERLSRPAQGPAADDEANEEDEESVKEDGRHCHHRCGEDAFSTKRTMTPTDEDQEDWWWNLNPNIYHRHFVLRESNLEKIRTLTPFSYFAPAPDESKQEGRPHRRRQRRHTAASVQASSNFPWDPEGIAPLIEWRLLKYRDYALPEDFSHMIAARAREGFYLQSVLFDDEEEEGKPPKKKNQHNRIQLTLVFHWKPHVIIEYRIRAHWSNSKESFYRRTRSPRVEIFIRSDAEFAYLIQNSHLVRRRFQIMRAMQQQDPKGSQSLTALQKVEKLKTYLQYLFEGDDILNTLVDPDHQYFSGWESGKMEFELLKDRFCSFGTSRFVSEEDRYQTRCWYDLECVDFLTADLFGVVQLLAEAWADITLVKNDNQQKDEMHDGVIPSYVKFLGEPSTLHHYPSFCKIKIQYEYGRLVTLRCLFFNAKPEIRQGVKNVLRALLKDTFVCVRPFSSLLIRDQDHFVITSSEPDEEHSSESSSWQVEQRRRLEKKRSWYMPVGLWLIGEHIVHDYLWSARWSWPTNISNDQGLVPVPDLAFEFLCQARTEQGYQLVLSRSENTHFYQELQHQQIPHAIQYFIRKETDGRIQTELWVEPSVGQKYYDDNSKYDAIQSWTSRQDRKIISHLVTFDQIHAMGRGCSVTLSDLFDVSLVLKPNPFLIVSYALPRQGEFHRYFESVARSVMDAEIEMSGASPLVWRMLRKVLRQYDETRMTEMLCFTQIVDPQRFFLLVIPPHQLDCLVFACTRMTMEEAPNLLAILNDESEVEVVDQGGAFVPPRTKSCFLKDTVVNQVKAIHGRAFLKAIYAALLPSRKVWLEDLDQALSVCQTTLISIDLTTFVSTLQDNTCGDDMEMKWKTAWSPHFDEITKLSNEEDDDEDAKPVNVLLYVPSPDHSSEDPLFLGLSCTSEDHPTIQDPMSFTELESTLIGHTPSKPSFLTTNHDPIKLNLICRSDGPLTTEQTQVMNLTVARLDWMFTEQVLHQALCEPPTKPVLQYVETQLDKHSQNPWTMPFRFVMTTNGQQVFMDLLEKMDSVDRQGEYFYVTGTTLYWLLMVVHTDHLQMYYHTFSPEEHDQVVEKMKERIGLMEKQTNQTLLLTKLQETRSCSKYLEAPDQTMSPKSDDSGSSQDTTSDTSKEDIFGVGEFQCPEIYCRSFPVHWRVPPHKALSYLKNDVLRPFLVMNRNQMYVIEREGTVVYCHFREKSLDGGFALEMSVHGLECPVWIERDVVPLIENRLTDEVTLVELQTFFARNPTSKPTSADVEFILPFGKQPPLRETFCLPMTVDLSKLFRFFKRSLLSHLLRSFQGSQVVAALDAHLSFSKRNEESDMLEKDELCFYYNCTKRIPGISSAIEVACGQGMAGLLMTVRDTSTSTILTELPCTNPPTFDSDKIRLMMEKDIRKTQGRYVLQIDLWTRGAVEGQILLDHIHNCFRRSVCDTLMEQTVSLDLVSQSPGLRNQFIEAVIYLLTKSVEWNNPTVQTLNAAGLDPWCMTEMMQGLKDELMQLDVTLDPITLWRKLDNDGNEEEWRLYRGRARQVGDYVRIITVSGLSEFISQFGYPSNRISRHPKDRLGLKSIPPSRKNSIPQPGSTTASLRSQPTSRSRAPSSSSSISSSTSSLMVMNEEEDVSLHPLGGSFLVPQADTEKHCFLIMIIDPDRLNLYAYNWAEPLRVRFFQKIWALIQYQRLRAGLLDNILHQKMGLFHHSQPVQTLADQFFSESTLADDPSSQSGEDEEEPRRPEARKSVSGLKVVTMQHRETMSIQQIIRKPSLTAGSIPSTPTSLRTPASDKRREGGGSTTTSLASPLKKPSISSGTFDEDKKRPQRRRVSTRKEEVDLLSMANPELNQVLLAAISDPVAGRRWGEEDDDVLWRHGEPFLTAYLQQARLRSAHCKARQVYSKWRQRFSDVEQEQDGLTRYEVASILRSSRFLHFCRAPFFLFSDLACYQSTFIAQYARYLEKLNMQRVRFTSMDDEKDNAEDEEPRSTYLLKVFDAGSILCEVRFTRKFVSVTLYGLHRGAGGPPKPASKKTRRRDFQMFEKNVARLKHLIHINSFVYDFHLAYLQQKLSEGGGDDDVVPALHRFGAYYTTPTPYSTNRLFSGVYQVVSTDLEPLYATIVKEKMRFGLESLGGDEEAMRVTDVQDLNAVQQDNDEEEWKYSLVLCPLQTERHCLHIRYFVLAVHQVERTPGGLVKNVWSAGGQDRVLVNARKKIDAIISKVIKTCHERSDWHRLVSTLNGSHFDRWRVLLHKFRHVSLLKGAAEPDLVRVVSDIHRYQSAAAVFDLFEQIYRNRCVQAVDSDQRHILFFLRAPPSSTADHLIHIKIDDNAVDLWLVRRDSPISLRDSKDDIPHNTTTDEKHLVALLGQGLCYILWKLSH